MVRVVAYGRSGVVPERHLHLHPVARDRARGEHGARLAVEVARVHRVARREVREHQAVHAGEARHLGRLARRRVPRLHRALRLFLGQHRQRRRAEPLRPRAGQVHHHRHALGAGGLDHRPYRLLRQLGPRRPCRRRAPRGTYRRTRPRRSWRDAGLRHRSPVIWLAPHVVGSCIARVHGLDSPIRDGRAFSRSALAKGTGPVAACRQHRTPYRFPDSRQLR